MVVLVVDDLGITVGKAKSDAPVCLNYYRPNPFPCPLKLVQTQRWNVHVINGLCFIKLRENQAEPFSVNRLDSSSIAGKEEFLQSLVSEGFDHKDQCNPFGHMPQPIRLRSLRTTSAVQRSNCAAPTGVRTNEWLGVALKTYAAREARRKLYFGPRNLRIGIE